MLAGAGRKRTPMQSRRRKTTFVTPFGAILKRLRNKAGYSQLALGLRLRPDVGLATATQYVYRLETGKILPCVEDIRQLAKTFKVKPEKLEETITDYSSLVYVKVRERRTAAKPPAKTAVVGSTLYHMTPEKFAAVVNGILDEKIRYVRGCW